MEWLIGSSLRLRRLVVVAALGIMAFGVLRLGDVPVDALPEFSPPTVEVQTEALGLSAAEVEQLITVPLEQDLLNGVAFLERIESASLPGLSSVVMTFEPGTDLLDARQVVQERLTQAHGLPNVAKPPQMIQPVSSTSRVSMVRLSSSELSPIEMSVLARWVISPRLLGVDGVANVAIWGERERQLQVLVDPSRLRSRGVSLQDVIETAGNALEVSPLTFLEASTPGTGGFIDTVNQRLQIFHEQAITTAQELAEVPLDGSGASGGGAGPDRLSLGDVAEVVEDHQPLIGDALCRNGDCLLLVVEKFPGARTVEVTEGVEAALDGLRPGLTGMDIDTSVYRPASYVDRSIDAVGRALLIGAILLALVIGVLLFRWRTALIAAVAIALSAAVLVLVLVLAGVTVDAMILAGLVLALLVVVDDAIGDVTTVAQRVTERRREDGASALRAIVDAVLARRAAVLAGTLVGIAALVPVFFLGGEAGAFLPRLALAYLLGIGASVAVALLVTPALAVMLLGSEGAVRDNAPVARWLHAQYERISPRVVRGAGPALVVVGLAVAALAVSVPFLDRSMGPSLQERDVLVRVEAPPGTSLQRMDDLTKQAVQDLAALEGIRSAGAQLGRAVVSDQTVNVNAGDIWVNVDPSADYDAALAGIEGVAARYPELSARVTTYSEERVSSLLGRPVDDVVVRTYGANLDVLQTKAEEIRSLLAGTAGVADARVAIAPLEPTVEVEVDLARAQALGVKPGDARRTAAILFSGITVGNLFEDQKVFDVVVWGDPALRESEADVAELPIETPDGRLIRLGDVADVRTVPNPAVIRHESVSTYVDVTADVQGRSVDAVVEDLRRDLRSVEFPLEHHAEILGGFGDLQAARSRGIAVTIAAVLAILLILQAALTSWRLAVMAFLMLPVALAGGAVAAWISGGTITLGSVAGAIGVVGITARGAVGSIRHYQWLERTDRRTFGPDLVLRGTRDRLVPILTTALAMAAVVLPFVIGGGGAGLEIIRPMAIVTLGGIVAAVAVQLFVLPALYLRFGFVREPDTAGEDLAAPLRPVDAIAGS
jgi:Cu/Ag efflux pump CusA